jgi:Holliday junction DNA helicase RuvA
MIARICGKISEKKDNCLFIDVGGITYQVFISGITSQRLNEHIDQNGTISLITYHYLQVEPARSLPILIGFLNEVEKDFFESFITVSGIGPRAALRALNKPISSIARAIDESNVDFLKSLPGIGQQRAREIIAKLQDKIGKFGLVRDEKIKIQEKRKNFEEEAVNLLMQLQYKKQEALRMINKALEKRPEIQSTEELLNQIYRQRKQDV